MTSYLGQSYLSRELSTVTFQLTLMNLEELPEWVSRRLFTFLNRARTPEDIIGTDARGLRIKDAPGVNASSGYTIGTVGAQRIIEHRSSLPNRRYTQFSQLLDVPGIGADKVQDLAYTFGQPADQAFLEDLYDGILFSNFDVKIDPTSIPDERHFLDIVDQPSAFLELVKTQVQELSIRRFDHPTAARLAAKLLETSYVESFQSGNIGAYALALWFFRFDEDNWFSFERIHAACNRYLNSYRYQNDRMELRLFKGFDPGGVLTQAIAPLDLPVVVNYAEQKVSILIGQLID